MTAYGTKRTWAVRCTCLLIGQSGHGAFAPHMSAFDPKRTSLGSLQQLISFPDQNASHDLAVKIGIGLRCCFNVQLVTFKPVVSNLLSAVPRLVSGNVDIDNNLIPLGSVFPRIGKHRPKRGHSIFVGLWRFAAFRCLNDNPAAP